MPSAICQHQHQSYKIGTEKTGLSQERQKQQPTDNEVEQLLQDLQQLIQLMVKQQMEKIGSGGGDEERCGGARGAKGAGGGGSSVAAMEQMLILDRLNAMIKQQEGMNKHAMGGGGEAPPAYSDVGQAPPSYAEATAQPQGGGSAPPSYAEATAQSQGGGKAPPAYSQIGEAPPAYTEKQTPAKIQVGDKMSGPQPKGMSDEQWSAAKEAGEATGMDPYILAAQAKQESRFGADKSGPSGGDGTWQVEPSTQQAYAGKFKEKFGHDYKHGDVKDEAKMAALIVTSKGSDDMKSNLMKYNGGDQYVAGQSKDSYGRPIEADKYAEKVMNYAAEMRAGG